MKNYQTGFTLIELLVTIAIMGIIASLAIPSFADAINRGKLDRAASLMETALKVAKAESSIRRRNTYVIWDGAKNIAVTTDKITVSGSSTTTTSIPISAYNLNNGITLTMTPATPTTLTFSPQGSASAATVYKLCQAGLTNGVQITISLTGRISTSSAGVCS